MRIFFDTEFTGLHKNTTLISIGLIDENGQTFYAEFTDYDKSQCDDWINKNVLAHTKLIKNPDLAYTTNTNKNSWEVYGDKEYIKNALKDWLSIYDNVVLVSDVSHYDMVLFIDIFGGAFDLPSNVGAACHDINQDIARFFHIDVVDAFDWSREHMVMNYIEHLPDGDKHNSLYDAKIIREIYNIIHK